MKKDTKIILPDTVTEKYNVLKMNCIEQAVKLGGNPDQALSAAKSFYSWMTEKDNAP